MSESGMMVNSCSSFSHCKYSKPFRGFFELSTVLHIHQKNLPYFITFFFHKISCMEKSRFPNKLKAFRDMKGLSQKAVARQLGLADASLISRWEKGRVMPPTVQVFNLCNYYAALPQELYPELLQESA